MCQEAVQQRSVWAAWQAAAVVSDSAVIVRVSQDIQGEMAETLPQHGCFHRPRSPSPSLPAAVPPLCVVIYISILHQPSCLSGHLHPKW